MPLLRVLVLDDEKPVRECVLQQLTARGFDAAAAANAMEALAVMQCCPFDLVVCDLRMPGMGGIEFLRQAITRYPETGVVLMSGTHDLRMAVEAMRLGALDYIS